MLNSIVQIWLCLFGGIIDYYITIVMFKNGGIVAYNYHLHIQNVLMLPEIYDQTISYDS